MTDAPNVTPRFDPTQLYVALDAISDSVALFDDQDRMAYHNAAYGRIVAKYNLPDLIGRTAAEIVQLCLDHRIFRIPTSESEFVRQRADVHNGTTTSTIVTTTDGASFRVTEHPMENGWRVAIYAQVTELEEARLAAVAANAAKSNFLSTMSHEIRTPLTALLGMLDLLTDEADPARRDTMLQSVRLSGETLRDIVNDILDVSKIEAGKMRLDLKPFHPTEVVRAVIDRHRQQAQWKGLDLNVQVDASYSRTRIWDALRFGQILDNLLGNAVKFTNHGMIALKLTDRSGEALQIAVTDTGIGMTPEQIDAALRPYEQAEPHIARVYGGTGLGLSIVARLTELAGGTFTITSDPEVGSIFAVTLPLPEGIPDTGPQSVARDVPQQRLAGRRILIADDDVVVRQVLEGMLHRMGAGVTAVNDAEHAITLAERSNYDAILMDNSMPGLNGSQAVRVIRDRLGAACPPIIVVTASLLEHEVRAFLDAGFDAHLGKPFRRAELENLIWSVLSGQSA